MVNLKEQCTNGEKNGFCDKVKNFRQDFFFFHSKWNLHYTSKRFHAIFQYISREIWVISREIIPNIIERLDYCLYLCKSNFNAINKVLFPNNKSLLRVLIYRKTSLKNRIFFIFSTTRNCDYNPNLLFMLMNILEIALDVYFQANGFKN